MPENISIGFKIRFGGEITDAKYEKLKVEITKTIELEEDSVISVLRSTRYTKREIIGLSKGGHQVII